MAEHSCSFVHACVFRLCLYPVSTDLSLAHIHIYVPISNDMNIQARCSNTAQPAVCVVALTGPSLELWTVSDQISKWDVTTIRYYVQTNFPSTLPPGTHGLSRRSQGHNMLLVNTRSLMESASQCIFFFCEKRRCPISEALVLLF